MGQFTTPTYRHRWGKYVKHTLVTTIAQADDAVGFEIDLDEAEIPIAVFAGRVWARTDDYSGAGISLTLGIVIGATTIGDPSGNIAKIYNKSQTITTDPDGWGAVSLFHNVPAPANAHHVGGITLPTREMRLKFVSDTATTSNTTIWIAMLSHRMEV